MVNGIPLYWTLTNGAKGDNPEFRRMLAEMDDAAIPQAEIHADGGYDSWETYSDVFLRTGKVMAGNPGCDAVLHPEYGWKNLLRRYNGLHRERGFIPSGNAQPAFIIRFLANHGHKEAAGMFLRNLDLVRGKKARAENARRRHICETVHHGMKRWVDFTVRGLHSRHVGAGIFLKLFVCTLLCVLFPPYMG